jgi:hypothetical protein
MDRKAHPGDAVLVNSREMTCRSQTLPWWLGVEEVKTKEIKIHLPRWDDPTVFVHKDPCYSSRPTPIFFLTLTKPLPSYG